MDPSENPATLDDLQRLRRRVAEVPGDWLALAELAHAAEDLGLLAEAAECFERLCVLMPDAAAAHSSLGRVLWLGGKPEEARAPLERAVKLKPDAPRCVLLASVYAALNLPLEREVALRLALRLEPGDADALAQLALFHLECGDPAGAVELLERAVASDPDHAGAHFQLGLHFADHVDTRERSRALLERSIELDFDQPLAHITLGYVLHHLGDFEGARRAHVTACNLNPVDATLWALTANFEFEADRPDEARAFIDHALSLNADDPQVRRIARRIAEGEGGE